MDGHKMLKARPVDRMLYYAKGYLLSYKTFSYFLSQACFLYSVIHCRWSTTTITLAIVPHRLSTLGFPLTVPLRMRSMAT